MSAPGPFGASSSLPLDLPPQLPEDTVDLRSGPEIHPQVLSLLPLVGLWRGSGQGGYPTIDGFSYRQQIRFFHDGRPFIGMEAKSWLMTESGEFVRPAAREVGWWRVGSGDEIELVLAHQSGIVEVYVGEARTTTSWELRTDVVARTATAKEVTANHRLYGLVEGELMYAIDMAAVGQPLQPHLSARLQRIT